MQRKIITLLLVAIFTNLGYAQSEKINIKTDHLTEANYLKIDDFYLTHYLYIDLFLRENLFSEVNPKDVSSIINALKKYVSLENKLDIEIEKPGKRNYLIRFTVLKKDDGTELLIAFTNWSVKEKKFEKEIKMENDSYTRWYFLNGNKMTYRKDMSSEKDYSTMNDIDLANAYLFDELSENDNDVEITVKKGKKKEEDIYYLLIGDLILLKNSIYTGDKKRTEKLSKQIMSDLEKNKNENGMKGVQRELNATIFQIELINLME